MKLLNFAGITDLIPKFFIKKYGLKASNQEVISLKEASKIDARAYQV
ncbi:MAG: hypothetical protein GX892_10960 [Thermoanaerobacteraceae bacterium]|nr:hypothetical protein [Thermoanaerobacteraceae bacterium]